MIITHIKKIAEKKFEIYIDDVYCFLLYPQDLRRYHLAEGSSISESLLAEIEQDVVLKKGKNKAMSYLARGQQSEHMIRTKLKHAGYSEKISNQIITFLKSYCYLDDKAYAENYVECHNKEKSRKQMELYLLQKGISKDIIEYALADFDGKEALNRLLQRKMAVCNMADEKVKNRIMNSFMRKGYSYYEIKNAMERINDYNVQNF